MYPRIPWFFYNNYYSTKFSRVISAPDFFAQANNKKQRYYMNLLKYIFIIILLSSFYVGCTDNPFFEDTEFWSDKLSMKGRVELIQVDDISLVEDKSGVFVWLEGLNASTYTNSEGKFELHLSSPATLPGGATAWNGVFKLYYYIANYQYEYSEILIRNGKVEYGQGDLDDKGNIKETVKLNEILSIKTTINPCSTNTNLIFRQKVNLALMTNKNPVKVETFVPLDETSGCIILKRLDAPSTLSVFVLANKNTLRIINVSGSLIWNMQLGGADEMGIKDMDPIPIDSGSYEVVPYLVIEQEGLPKELLNNISMYYNVFSSEYLKLPFKWDLDTLIVE